VNQYSENGSAHDNLPVLLDRIVPLSQNATTDEINATISLSPPTSLKLIMASLN